MALVACVLIIAAVQTPVAAARRWVDQPITFPAGVMTIHGTYRHPAGAPDKRLPAVLLIAGSGPTDRNGNTPLVPGKINTLKTLADWLSQDGVATLRYDKLGSGQTGWGPYKNNPGALGIAPYEQEAAAGLGFLAVQRRVDPARLGVFGHSEGALFALLAATGHGAGVDVPHVRALGLLQPLSERYLNVISVQIRAQVKAARTAGQITPAEGTAIDHTLADAIAQLRIEGTVPNDLPGPISSVLNPQDAMFLRQADRYDPAALAALLPRHTSVLTSCSNDDIQVSCSEVDMLDAGVNNGLANLDAVRLRGVDHMLKVDPSRTGTDYGKPLPFSPRLRSVIASWVKRAL